MKALLKILTEKSMTYRNVNYRHAASGYKYTRKGLDIFDKDGHILAYIEPRDDSRGDKWLLVMCGRSRHYCRNIIELTKIFKNEIR